MMHVTIPIPSDLQQWIESRIGDGVYVDAADYVRDLVRRDQEAYAVHVRHVRVMIEEGLASGVIDAEPEDILDEIIAGITR